MDDTDALSIGAFARRVGLAPSALRFYDDCDVLRPAYKLHPPASPRRRSALTTALAPLHHHSTNQVVEWWW
ncbi:hypothetical protein [Streptomyces sp. NPDC005507]|uniref:hypothetical protein n=1 Tax=unclassified Streptomyces TaxID=2593676 RepID=UPI00339E587A